MSSSWRKAVRNLIVQPDYVLAIALLGASAIGLNFCTDYLKLHFRKQPVQMRVSALDAADGLPATLGNWVMVSKDKPLDPDTEHILGTRQYVQREYVNTRTLDESQVRQLELSGAERDKALMQIEAEHPEAVIDVGIFYYTGMVDTVAHIPERCYTADGFEPTNYELEKDREFGVYSNGHARRLSYRFLNFEDQSGKNRLATNVAYLFHVNGHYENDPLGVRRSLQNLLEPDGYYAKVELKTISRSSSEEARHKAQSAMEDLLKDLLPEFERCLPDWEKVHAKAVESGKAGQTINANEG